MNSPWLHRYTILLAVCTIFLVIAGASVTSNEAGLSVPDWPLSYGKLMPDMIGGVFYEHGHRMIATFVGLLTIGLVIWVFRERQSPSWMRKLSLVALGGVIVQGLLGGLTVLLLLPPQVSVAHACVAQLFFSTTVAFVLFTSKGWRHGPDYVQDQGWPSLRSLAIFSPLVVLAQIALGASFRHHALGILPHILGAMMVAMVLLIVGAFVLHQFPAHKALRKAATNMMAMTFLQIFLGISAYLARVGADPAKSPSMLPTTVAHVVGGGLTLAATILLSIQIRRNVRAPESSSAGSQAAVSS
jgi:cytochrome c oxidase assembly protein subunit 15